MKRWFLSFSRWIATVAAHAACCARRSCQAKALVVFAFTLFAVPATAAPAWFDTPYNYIVLDQDIRVALTEFGRNLGMPVVLSDVVKGRVRGRIEARQAGEFMERLASANGLTWYFDGSILHVSADTEFVTRVLDAGRLSGEAVEKRMHELGLADERFSVRGSRDGNVITVSGPPAYVAVVDQLVQRMQPAPVVAGDYPRVRVFRGGVETEVVLKRVRSDQTGSGTENTAREETTAKP